MLPELKTRYVIDKTPPLNFDVPETEFLKSLRGYYIDVPVTPSNELLDTFLVASEGTKSWYLHAEDDPRNLMGENFMREGAQDVHNQLEELCDKLEKTAGLPFADVSLDSWRLNHQGLNTLYAQTLRNAGHSNSFITQLIGSTEINSGSNIAILWCYDDDFPRYDFTYIPTTLTNLADMILNNASMYLHRTHNSEDDDSPQDLLTKEAIDTLKIIDWEDPTDSEVDSIYQYLLDKIKNNELCFAKIPTHIEKDKVISDKTITTAVLIPSIQNLRSKKLIE